MRKKKAASSAESIDPAIIEHKHVDCDRETTRKKWRCGPKICSYGNYTGYTRRRSSAAASSVGNHCSLSERSGHASDSAIIDDSRVNSNGVICISSSLNYCNEARTSSEKSLNISQNSIARLRLSASSSETTTPFIENTCQLKMRIHPSMSSSCSETLRSSESNGSRTIFGLVEKSNCRKDARSELLDGSQDPYAFDEDDFQLSKWDLLSGKHKISRTRNSRINSIEVENGYQFKLSSQEESSNGENWLQKSSNTEHYHSQKSSHCSVPDEEHSSLLADCLLTAIKVLMNLTNDNPIGCQQIAVCGGLETMSTLIAGHFPLIQLIYILGWCDARGRFKH
ncbi:wings apart protein [Salix suchowensis]|nr:wings apart protein [Salix suchowensis]